MFFFLLPTTLVAIFPRAATSFVFGSMIFFLRVDFVAVRVVMICISPVVVFMIFYIAYSASCSLWVSPSDVTMAPFDWYPADLDAN